MKKVFAIIALMGVFTFGMTQSISAQDEAVDSAATEQVDSAAVDTAAATVDAEDDEVASSEPVETGMYKNLKTKFIEGDAGFMAIVAIALVLGLAFCIERIIYLALSKINTVKFIDEIESAVKNGNIEGAKEIARNTRGPIASIYYQGLLRLNDGADAVEKSVVAYGAVQASKLESGCSWITLFIGMAPSLGFLGTVIGMVQAFDDIQAAGDISPTVVAGGMKVALLTTIFGIIVALILQVFYNYILAEIEGLTAKMEDSTLSLLDIVAKHCNK